jgi:hypothetical protein
VRARNEGIKTTLQRRLFLCATVAILDTLQEYTSDVAGLRQVDTIQMKLLVFGCNFSGLHLWDLLVIAAIRSGRERAEAKELSDHSFVFFHAGRGFFSGWSNKFLPFYGFDNS